MNKVRILILSAGSLLGQNILDALEGRRNNTYIIGVNLHVDNPRLYRCDKAYKVPAIEDANLTGRLLEIIADERPDIILPGRDHDVLLLARLKDARPRLSRIIPCGSLEAVEIMNDKALSFEFARQRQLPFADTLLIENADEATLQKWMADKEFPVLAKPKSGFGSIGVRIISNWPQLLESIKSSRGNLVLQELLDHGETWKPYIARFSQEMSLGTPLFFALPEESQYAGQALIRPDGQLSTCFCSINTMVMGRCERTEECNDRELRQLTTRFAEAMAGIGWRGMFNFQCKKGPDGRFKGHEMNGRMSGSTSARRWLGFDEVRETLKAYVNADIGDPYARTANPGDFVMRSLSDYLVSTADMQALQQNGIWERQSQ